jgi:two-component system, NarL family, nitrate/nitrite response regulator NarL
VKEESPIRVFLVAPMLLRWGLERLLSTAPQIELSGSACSVMDAAEEIESQYPDVVVVDGNDCSPEDIRALYERARVKILALESGGERHPQGVAQTWVDTRQSPGSFVRAIVNTASARSWPQQTAPESQGATQLSEPSAAETLTRKQRKVAEVIAANPSAPAKVVADLLHMSEHTLRNHLTEIYAKLRVTGRTHLQALLSEQPRLLSA